MTAQGRLSGLVLTGLPFLVSICLILFSPEYFRPMIETRSGWYMMGYALVSILLGHIVIQRLVDRGKDATLQEQGHDVLWFDAEFFRELFHRRSFDQPSRL
jgi:hypothetical protein